MPTGIEWTDETWNPVTGCSPASPGCDNCYAERQSATRLSHVPAYQGLTEGGRWTGELRLLPDRLEHPLRWKRPRRIFVNSMSDLFHPKVPVEYICRVFEVMAKARQHQFQILTKRPQRMASIVRHLSWAVDWERPHDRSRWSATLLSQDPGRNTEEPLPNVWLGVSIESQDYAFRARYLADTPAAVRFVSAEPLLGFLDLSGYLGCRADTDGDGNCHIHPGGCPKVDWLIAGGESGPGARPMHPDWVRSLRDQCQKAGVAFLFKQAGSILGREWGCTDSKGGDWDAWPPDLRIREYPG